MPTEWQRASDPVMDRVNREHARAIRRDTGRPVQPDTEQERVQKELERAGRNYRGCNSD